MEIRENLELIEVRYEQEGKKAILTFLDSERGEIREVNFNRQSFKVSADSLPEGAVPKDLMRQVLTIRGRRWTVRDVTGNDSGILNLDLIPSGGNA